MPVKKNPNGDDWCFGSKCGFSSKKKAQKAEAAYYAKNKLSKDKMVKKSMEQTTIKAPTDDIMKATADDVRRYLLDTLKANYIFEDGYVYGVDYDKEYVFFTVEYYGQGYYDITYRLSYTLNGVTVTFNGELEEVKKETIYTPIEKPKNKIQEIEEEGNDPFEEDGNIFRSLDKKISNAVQRAFDKIAGKKELPIIKQFEEEEQISIEILYSFPNEADLHNEGMTAETIEKMVESANVALEEGRLSCGLFHTENRDDIEILKIWVNPVDCTIGNTFVPEGSALAEIKYYNDEIWKMRVDGILGGLSIGAKGTRKENTDI